MVARNTGSNAMYGITPYRGSNVGACNKIIYFELEWGLFTAHTTRDVMIVQAHV